MRAAKGIALQEFADDWNVTVRTVTNWIAAGMPHRQGRDGKRTVVRKEANRWVRDRDVAAALEAEKGTKTEGSAIDQAELRMKGAQAELKELELQERLEKLLEKEVVEEELEAFIAGFAATAGGELARFERDIVQAATPAAARILTTEIHEALMRGAQRYADTLEATPVEEPAAA